MRSFFIAILIGVASSPTAYAWKVPMHKDCPTLNPSIKWVDYMSGAIPPGKIGTLRSRPAMVGINFKSGIKNGHTDAVDGLDLSRCYSVAYNFYLKGEPAGYSSWYSNKNGEKRGQRIFGLKGDPKKYEINVYGTVLMFDEGGRILDFRGRMVGEMTCYTTNMC